MSSSLFSHARVAGVVLGITLGLIAFFSPRAATAIWPFDKKEDDPGRRAAALLSEAIRIRTDNPPGGEAKLAEHLAAVAREAGIEARVVPTPGPGEGPDARAAVWARLPGRLSGNGLILLSHLDVVPADPAEWQRDPYAGEITDGLVYGRGALDAKGVTITHLMTLLELAARDEPPPYDVIFLGTPDEEAGGRDGAGYVVDQHPELYENARWLLTEGGGIRAAAPDTPGGRSVWGITITEKAPCWLELRALGQPSHSSAPRPDAAVPRLIAALDRVRRIEMPIKVLVEVERMFAAMAPLASEEDRPGYAHLAEALQSDAAFQRRFLQNPGHNALVRNTIGITVLEGGPRTNVSPGLARAHLDGRLLPGERCEDLVTALADLLSDLSIEIEVLLTFPSRASAADTPLFRAIESVAAAREPSALVTPRVIGGFTDAHWFRAKGLVAYGFVPRWLQPSEARGVHGKDEAISVRNLRRGVEAMVEIVDALHGELSADESR